MHKLIILDRDGVINYDSDNFIKTVDEWRPLPGSIDAIARLKKAGWTVTIATNQSGISRGLYSEATLHAMHDKMAELLKAYDVGVDYIAFCAAGPESDDDCRKPKPGMYQKIAAEFNVDLENVPVIGDSLRDLQAAQAVKALPILVRTGKGERTIAKNEGLQGIAVYDDLAAVVDHLVGESK